MKPTTWTRLMARIEVWQFSYFCSGLERNEEILEEEIFFIPALFLADLKKLSDNQKYEKASLIYRKYFIVSRALLDEVWT